MWSLDGELPIYLLSIYLSYGCPILKYHLLKKLPFLYWIAYVPLSKINRPYFLKYFLLLFKYSCHFSPTTPHLPSVILPPFGFVHVPLYMFLDDPSPFSRYPLPSPLWLLSVLYFNVSGYILLPCLFCWLGSTYRWDHMVFVFHCLAKCLLVYFWTLFCWVEIFLVLHTLSNIVSYCGHFEYNVVKLWGLFKSCKEFW